MSKILKILVINIAVFAVLVFSLSIIISNLGSSDIQFEKNVEHPCLGMKTDVLLTHVFSGDKECNIPGGKILGEYVTYDDFNQGTDKILLLGGSTTSGFNFLYSDGWTYPRFLTEYLNKEYSILNGGVAGYSSLQEFYKLSRDLQRFEKLKYVFSFNGINDLPSYHGEEHERFQYYPYLTSIQNDMNIKQNWIDQRLLGDPLISSFAINLLKLFSGNKTKEDIQDKKLLEIYKKTSAGEVWETNVKRMNSLANIANVKYFLFLQPTLGLKENYTDTEKTSQDYSLISSAMNKNPSYLGKIRRLYNDLKQRCSKLSFCYDLSGLLDTSNNYKDIRHPNKNGNQKIASEIARILRAYENKQQ